MKNKNFTFYKYLSVVFLTLILSSCSTTKNTLLHRGWHNMNARYNGYFYSKENFKETVKRVEKSNRDDYTQIVPLFVYPTNATAKNYYGDFDKTIKKSSVVIQRHAITSKKTKEEIPNACRWIDENYMLIGKAHFYKRDFFSALEAFDYVSKKYPNPDAKYNAMLWMIRTNNEIGSYSQSEPIIDELRNAKDFPKDRSYQQEYAAVSADYYIKRAEYQQGIKQLSKALALTKNKKIRARFTFVLAQLYEKLGDNSKASMYYGQVPKLHPESYDMEFNAKINRARLFDVNSGNTKDIKKELARMLKDDKNSEFKDQIYYVLADIAYREKDIPLAIVYLNQSVRASVGNNTQKALSYLKRADIYFDKTDYQAAEANYDSTMSILPKEYPDYASIAEKKKSLTALVVNLKTIALEDSVQVLANMSEKERNAVIDKLIAKVEEEEKRKEEEKLQEQNNQQFLNQNAQVPGTVPGNSGAWYFYNPSTVSFGIADFTKKWGGRKLEDNWRRSQKDEVLAGSTSDNEEAAEGTPAADTTGGKDKATAAVKGANNKKDRAYYLKSIPLTQDALAKSNGKILDAYYNVGSIYKEQLQNNSKSVQTFEELLKRFPENKYKLSTYYQLYRTYLLMNNKTKADYYKNILVNDYPDSEYAMIIKNPESAKDVAASRNLVENFYAETYQMYSEGKYAEALANCRKADTMYSKSHLMPQFAFIKALCIGRTQDIDAFERALTQITIKYPKEPVKEKALEMLEMIKRQKSGVTTNNDTTAAKPKFVFNDKGEYYWITIVLNGKGDLNKFKTKLSDLNSESFSTDDLHISNVFLDITHQLVTVKTFDGKEKAMNYYNFMKDKNRHAFDDLEPGSYQSIVISAENYTTFYKEKNIDEYQEFFTKNFK